LSHHTDTAEDIPARGPDQAGQDTGRRLAGGGRQSSKLVIKAVPLCGAGSGAPQGFAPASTTGRTRCSVSTSCCRPRN